MRRLPSTSPTLMLSPRPLAANNKYLEANLNAGTRFSLLLAVLCAFAAISLAQDAHFHNAPVSTMHQQNPLAGQSAAIPAGAKLYSANCAACHGATGEGGGNIPALS